MADVQAAEAQPESSRKGLMPIMIGIVLATVLGGAGFMATYSGLLDVGGTDEPHSAHGTEPLDTAFVPMDPVVISLGRSEGAGHHLRFQANLEVTPGEEGTVEALMPRILDVLNSYLRAVEVEEIERPTALIRIRAQMLRRIQLVVGGDRVRDLLISQFVLN
jgi:flagellar FliL protein